MKYIKYSFFKDLFVCFCLIFSLFSFVSLSAMTEELMAAISPVVIGNLEESLDGRRRFESDTLTTTSADVIFELIKEKDFRKFETALNALFATNPQVFSILAFTLRKSFPAVYIDRKKIRLIGLSLLREDVLMRLQKSKDLVLLFTSYIDGNVELRAIKSINDLMLKLEQFTPPLACIRRETAVNNDLIFQDFEQDPMDLMNESAALRESEDDHQKRNYAIINCHNLEIQKCSERNFARARIMYERHYRERDAVHEQFHANKEHLETELALYIKRHTEEIAAIKAQKKKDFDELHLKEEALRKWRADMRAKRVELRKQLEERHKKEQDELVARMAKADFKSFEEQMRILVERQNKEKEAKKP